jgi:hypothetical protein
MSNQATARSPSFGAIDRPACPYCGERASLTRRSPHPDYGLHYEQQLFICSACDHTIERIVDASGHPKNAQHAFTLFELSTSLASHRDHKLIVPINIRFERQSGRRRFSSGCLFLTLN